jgi:hypothetical protein
MISLVIILPSSIMTAKKRSKASIANFQPRRSRKDPSKLSKNANTQATRHTEQLKTGPERARHNIMNKYRQRRYRVLADLRHSQRWATMTEEYKATAESDAVDAIDKERDVEIADMLAEWEQMTAVIRESEQQLCPVDDAPDTESDESDPEFEEDEEEAAKSGIPHQRDAQGRFQPDESTQSDLMDIWNRNVKAFQARTDILAKIGHADEEPWLPLDGMGEDSRASDSEEDMDNSEDTESEEK